MLRGEKGTGKTTLGRVHMRLFRNHALHVTNQRHLVGHFNAHLVDALALLVDEAFWAGDRAAVGPLNGLITERSLIIEPKGVNAFEATNRLKIMIASNADWVIPATADERRYFVLDVSNCRQGDARYFKELYDAIDGDELPAFLDHLLNLDLSDFNHRQPPATQTLASQKLVGADKLTAYWFDCLWAGELVGVWYEEDQRPDGWPEDVVRTELHRAYVKYAHEHGDRHPMSHAHMARKLAQMMPGGLLQTIRPNKRNGTNSQPWRYALDTLDRCRESFQRHMRVPVIDWPGLEEPRRDGPKKTAGPAHQQPDLFGGDDPPVYPGTHTPGPFRTGAIARRSIGRALRPRHLGWSSRAPAHGPRSGSPLTSQLTPPRRVRDGRAVARPTSSASAPISAGALPTQHRRPVGGPRVLRSR